MVTDKQTDGQRELLSRYRDRKVLKLIDKCFRIRQFGNGFSKLHGNAAENAERVAEQPRHVEAGDGQPTDPESNEQP